MNRPTLEGYYEILAQNLTRLLNNRSGAWLSKEAGTDPSTLSKLLKHHKGNVGFEILIRWARVLEVEPWDLIRGDSKVSDSPTLGEGIRLLHAFEAAPLKSQRDEALKILLHSDADIPDMAAEARRGTKESNEEGS